MTTILEMQYDGSGNLYALPKSEVINSLSGIVETSSPILQQILRSIFFVGTTGLLTISPHPTSLCYGSSSSVIDSRRPAPSTHNIATSVDDLYQRFLTVPIADQAREALAALSLNKSQLADVLGISRPTLYDWFEGKEPNSANAGRLTLLLRLLSRSGTSGTTPLNARFVRQPINDMDNSLVYELSAKQWNENEIERLLREARMLSDKAESLQRDREKRWRNLGYDEQSEDQRREQLNRNIAMLDWPKP